MENESRSLEFVRDCEAVQIPHGQRVILPRGTPFALAQNLGGSYTVHAAGGLYRIASRDADAIGETDRSPAASDGPVGAPATVDEAAVWDVLKTCYDPEIPVNIVDLGLVYEMDLEKMPTGLSRVSVKMTLTAPGCGMGATIAGDAQEKLLGLDGVEEASVEIVWDPPWHQSRITEEGRRILGLE